MPRVFAFVAAVPFAITIAVGCGSSGDDDTSATSANAVTTTNDAGDAAPADPCTPCAERFAAGAQKYEDAKHHCFCSDDVCHDACASTQCRPTNVSAANDACTSCINDSYNKCVQVVEAACEADAECTHYVACKLPASCKKQDG